MLGTSADAQVGRRENVMQTRTQLQISELQPADLARGFLETLESLTDVGLTPEAALLVLEARRKAGAHTFVARIEGQVIGTISLLIEHKFIHQGGLVGHIEDVAVHREHQKKGIGAELVRHATDAAKRLGCYKVILSCFESKMLFYKGLGYRPHDVGMRIDL